MMDKMKACTACGSNTFEQGEVGFRFANMKPIGKKMKTGSPLLITYCVQCGEVVSIKVKDLVMMKLL